MYINESRFVIGLENTPFTGVCSHFPTQKFDRTGAVKGLTCFLKAFCELKKNAFHFHTGDLQNFNVCACFCVFLLVIIICIIIYMSVYCF